MLLQQQYRERKFTKYSELISCFLVAKQNNELLLKNHQSRLTGSTAFPEVNGISFDNNRGYNGRGHGHGRKRGGHTQNTPRKNTTPYHRKGNYNETKQHGNGRDLQNKPPKTHKEKCLRYDMKGH